MVNWSITKILLFFQFSVRNTGTGAHTFPFSQTLLYIQILEIDFPFLGFLSHIWYQVIRFYVIDCIASAKVHRIHRYSYIHANKNDNLRKNPSHNIHLAGTFGMVDKSRVLLQLNQISA